MIHKMNLQDGPFRKIKDGSKDIEMRVFDEKRKLLNIDDVIIFNNDNTNEVLETLIINLHKFKNFKEMYENFDKVRIGYDINDEIDPNDMAQYYDEANILENGVVGIELKLLKVGSKDDK